MECAERVRLALKEELGYSSRKISVRTPTGANCFGAYVIIKDSTVDINKVKEVCNRFETATTDAFNDYYSTGDRIIISNVEGRIL